MDIQGENIWNELLSRLKRKLKPQIFGTWFKPLTLHSLTQDKLTIEAPSDFLKSWVEEKYLPLIREELNAVVGHEMKIEFVSLEKDDTSDIAPKAPLQKIHYTSRLNPKYNFDNFVVGNGNRLAHAAALAVAQSPSHAYNPLFIYGDVGLGKTHLLQAIAHYIIKNKPELSFAYVSSEQFTNELINAIRDDKTVEFREKYRNKDVLLVDDIHFLAGKERTQEEFFHTFNSLYEARKQIVLSSDRPPGEIPTLEKRLQSRFEWGLIADIQPPDLETRIAILKKKAEAENVHLPDKVALFIAERIKTNIRKLEGCLTRLIAYSSLLNRKIDTESAMEILKNILPKEESKAITIELIQKVVSRYYKIKESDLKIKRRVKSIALPRQVAMYLCRELTDASFPEIGEKFGGKDHTTIMYAHRKISIQKEKDEELKNQLRDLMRLLKEEG
ncbi:chromosomal replication initiator protein DnaA [Candidatus Aerophobetes bacterium]|nr:chromosomal replication initiator protein DnaA [Candidatus Aerophobetes bacterium]